MKTRTTDSATHGNPWENGQNDQQCAEYHGHDVCFFEREQDRSRALAAYGADEAEELAASGQERK